MNHCDQNSSLREEESYIHQRYYCLAFVSFTSIFLNAAEGTWHLEKAQVSRKLFCYPFTSVFMQMKVVA
jgi:hypothetical protein